MSYTPKSREEYIAKCRYYKGEEKNPYDSDRGTIWYYEKFWVEAHYSPDNVLYLRDLIQEYKAVGLGRFNQKDGTPIALKALLYNRYSHWIMGSIEDFKEWYKKVYYLTVYENMFDPLFIDRLAWTFSHQPELYVKHLTAPEAPQSAIGVATAAFMDALGKDWDTKTIYHYVVHALEVASQKGVWMDKTIHEFFASGYKLQPHELKMTLWPGAFIYSGMKASSEEEAKKLGYEWFVQLNLGKPGYYTQQLALQIYLWRNGKEQELTWTQIEACGINRPWKCIEAAHDYWSALDNAFRSDGYAPYTGIIVGALAEARWNKFNNPQ